LLRYKTRLFWILATLLVRAQLHICGLFRHVPLKEEKKEKSTKNLLTRKKNLNETESEQTWDRRETDPVGPLCPTTTERPLVVAALHPASWLPVWGAGKGNENYQSAQHQKQPVQILFLFLSSSLLLQQLFLSSPPSTPWSILHHPTPSSSFPLPLLFLALHHPLQTFPRIQGSLSLSLSLNLLEDFETQKSCVTERENLAREIDRSKEREMEMNITQTTPSPSLSRREQRECTQQQTTNLRWKPNLAADGTRRKQQGIAQINTRTESNGRQTNRVTRKDRNGEKKYKSKKRTNRIRGEKKVTRFEKDNSKNNHSLRWRQKAATLEKINKQ
jgi:hypothetical protein